MKDNNVILNQVKNLVSSKRSYTKKNSKKIASNTEEDIIKKEINKWLHENAEKISVQIISEHLKKSFKQ